MAPRQTQAPRRSTLGQTGSQAEDIYDLGVRGRKTGVTLKDTGVRDEHGMQPLDDLFSSPAKANANGHTNGHVDSEDEDEGEDDSDDGPMELEEVTGPAPASFMRKPFPIAKARSPVKTNLGSPAMKSKNFNPDSSPLRGSVVRQKQTNAPASAKRRLDFGKNPLALRTVPGPDSAASAGSRSKGRQGVGRTNGLVNGNHSASDDEEEEEELDEEDEPESPGLVMLGDDDGAEGDVEEIADDDEAVPYETAEEAMDEVEPLEEEAEEASVIVQPKKKRGRPKKSLEAAPPASPEVVDEVPEEVPESEQEEPVKQPKKRGRKPKDAEVEAEQPPPKRRRSDPVSTSEQDAPIKRKRGRPSKAHAVEEPPAPPPKQPRKPRAPKAAASATADTSTVEVPRGPPAPRSRGLLIRRETPGTGAGMHQTRSGRNSFKPLQFWRNERTQGDYETFGHGKGRFVLPSVKEVIRYDDAEPTLGPRRRRQTTASKTRRSRKRRANTADYDSANPDDDDDFSAGEDLDPEFEDWELNDGTVNGDVVLWQPEHEAHPPSGDDDVAIAPDHLAISGPAIQTREILNGSFRFAKTLSKTFFGSGVVDLPPGTEKRPKNSRRMQMTFFVHTGKVRVTVAETVFSITKGGMWFVPRGNYYGIVNEQDYPARIFFSQGNEVAPGTVGAVGDQSQLGGGESSQLGA